jgi:hypothetical protein
MPEPHFASRLPAALRRRRAVRRLFVRPEGVWDLDAADAGAAAPDLPLWLAAHPGSEIRVLLSGRLVHPLLVRDAALAGARDADRRAWARQQFLHYYGPEAADWPLVLWADAPVLAAAALHGADLPGWQSSAAVHGSRLGTIRPWWSVVPTKVAAAVNGWPGAGRSALMLLEGAHAAWMRFDDGRLCAVEQRRANGPDAPAVGALLEEWQAEHEVPDAATVVAGFGVLGRTDELAGLGRVLGDLGATQPDALWVTT